MADEGVVTDFRQIQKAWQELTLSVLAGALAGGEENYKLAVEDLQTLISDFPAKEVSANSEDTLACIAGDYLQSAASRLSGLMAVHGVHAGGQG